MKKLSIFGATMALLLVAFAGQATPIKATYSVDANSTDPGLVVHTQVLSSPLTLNLSEGQSTTVDLFNIWTDEGTVNRDDTVAKPISVNFDFILPTIFSGSVNGDTNGNRIFFGLVQNGEVSWDGPANLFFGANNDGQIRITLSDETFSGGFLGLGGSCNGATVQATIQLVKNATAVPEPGVLGMLGFGLLGIGFMLRKRSKR